MDAGNFTDYIRSKTLYDFHKNNPEIREQNNEKSNLIHLKRTVGAQDLYFQHKLIASCCPCVPQSYSYPDAALIALEDLLYYGAAQNWGPTRCSIHNYMWFHTITSAYSWIRPTSKITGIRDNWDWSSHYPLGEEGQFIWMNAVLIYVMSSFIPGYDTSILELNERTHLSISVEEQLLRRANVKSVGHWNTWETAWRTWYNNRSNDPVYAYYKTVNNVYACESDVGSNLTEQFYVPKNDDLPNKEKVLDPSETIDPALWPEPRKWTPLCLNGIKKTYLTYRWNEVVSSCLNSADEIAADDVGTSYFPSNLARDSEISELVLAHGSLTDAQKVSAEFWAGGPFTASPPGMLIWFWKEFMITQNIPRTCNFDAFFYSGFDLAQHIFETSRVVWGLKKKYMQARPIQDIRRTYRLQTLPHYRKNADNKYEIQGEAWVPYQESTFVTPPFADFPSGHSTYSQSFALVMTDWFGARIPESQPRELNDLELLSPTFTDPESFKYGQFIFRQGKSRIQPTIVPAQDVELRWATWQEMANSAGISRKYGGIHATSAHTGGQAVAQTLHLRIRNKSGLTV